MAVDTAAIGAMALNFAIVIVTIIVSLAATAGLWLWFRHWKRYQQFNVVIWEKDGFGQITETTDKAGIFVDARTKNKRFFLKKNKVGLSPDNVPYLPGKRKVVYLIKFGHKNFKYVNIRIEETGAISLKVGEEDVNWAVNAYQRSKNLFLNNLLLQLLPFIALAFVSIIILIMFIYLFKKLDALAEIMKATQSIAQNAAAMTQGTVVIPSG